MKEINNNQVIDLVEKLCMDANYYLNKDIEQELSKRLYSEESPLGKNVIQAIIENAKIAREDQVPICQDTGMAVVFVEFGTGVHFSGDIEEAINEGVRRGYKKGYLRNSVVKDPVDRVNTKDNTPAVIYYSVTTGDKIRITVAPKGFGSENMSAIAMLKPSDGIEGIKSFIIDTVSNAGANPCPPIIAGVGVGGTMEKCAILSKKALLRPVGSGNTDEFWNSVEKECLEKINSLGIGPAGFGGRTTALCVNIETFPTHIAGLPVAVNIGCHATRHAERIL
jgi:fumarate hydratase subunit alpha